MTIPSRNSCPVLDLPASGWWSTPPALANVAGMLVSTVDDLWAFASVLAAGGVYQGRRLLSAEAVEAMTTNHLTEAQRAGNELFFGARGNGIAVGSLALVRVFAADGRESKDADPQTNPKYRKSNSHRNPPKCRSRPQRRER